VDKGGLARGEIDAHGDQEPFSNITNGDRHLIAMSIGLFCALGGLSKSYCAASKNILFLFTEMIFQIIYPYAGFRTFIPRLSNALRLVPTTQNYKVTQPVSVLCPSLMFPVNQ
jgi:hypothetical protein